MDADDFIIGERNTGFQFRRFYGLLLSLALIKIGNHNAVIAVFLFQILGRVQRNDISIRDKRYTVTE